MADISLPHSHLSPPGRTALLATLGNPSVQLNQDIGDTGYIAGEEKAPDRRAESAEFTGA